MSVKPRDTRTRTLDAIRAALGVGANDAVRAEAVAWRLKRHPSGTVPGRAEGSAEVLTERFCEMLVGQKATVVKVARQEDIPQAVAQFLRNANLPARLRMGQDAFLSAQPWEQAGAIEIDSGAARGDDAAAITHAPVAAAETGTLFMTSGQDNPTTLNFLPETHIAVLRKGDIVGSYEEAWDRLRATYGEGHLPRSVNLISGPSRTADIEQTMVLGAHGPRRLHVIVVG